MRFVARIANDTILGRTWICAFAIAIFIDIANAIACSTIYLVATAAFVFDLMRGCAENQRFSLTEVASAFFCNTNGLFIAQFDAFLVFGTAIRCQ